MPSSRRAPPVVRRTRAPTAAERANRQAFGGRLRDLRLARGLSQERLAEQADLHRNHVGTVERGERSVGLDTILALAGALDVPPGSAVRGVAGGPSEVSLTTRHGHIYSPRRLALPNAYRSVLRWLMGTANRQGRRGDKPAILPWGRGATVQFGGQLPRDHGFPYWK